MYIAHKLRGDKTGVVMGKGEEKRIVWGYLRLDKILQEVLRSFEIVFRYCDFAAILFSSFEVNAGSSMGHESCFRVHPIYCSRGR